MSKSVVVECPKGVYTRLMSGSQAFELYTLANGPNGKKGNKQNPSHYDKFVAHMNELERKFKKETGRE